MLVVGESRLWKDLCSPRLAIELANHAIPSIIFDYGQGYALIPEAEDLAIGVSLKTLDR